MAKLDPNVQIEVKMDDVIPLLADKDQRILTLTALARQLVEELSVWKNRALAAEANQQQPADTPVQ